MASDAPPLLGWLDPLPIRYSNGLFVLSNDSTIEETFQQITDEAHHPRNRIPRRSPEVRRALSQTLRYAHNPALQGRGPWLPADPRYTPFRSTIAPLLSQPLWETARVIAAPLLAYIPRARIAGIIDVALQFPDGSTAIAVLQCSRRSEDLVPVARTELGGAIAALSDHRTLIPSHAITIWAAAGNTEIEYHHPDRCLGLWVDALDRARFARRLRAPRSPAPSK
jgi:hypothetical protein